MKINSRNILYPLLFWPSIAAAHTSSDVYYLIGWYFFILVGLFGYFIYPNRPWNEKIISIGVCLITTVTAWVIFGLKPPAELHMPNELISFILGISPLLGFIAGIYIVRKNVKT